MSFVPSSDPSRSPEALAGRYEIRQLTVADAPFAVAVAVYAQQYCNPVWKPKYGSLPVNEGYRAMTAVITQTIERNLSFGVFDREYRYKTKASQASNGQLLWDLSVPQSDPKYLLDGMDFPLVAVAFSMDAFNLIDRSLVKEIVALRPEMTVVNPQYFAALDTRPLSVKQPRGLGDVLVRAGTGTRQDYEGRGLCRYLADFVMKWAAEKGYRAIHISTNSDAVTRVWSTPPPPFKAQIITEGWVDEIEGPLPPTGEVRKVFPDSHVIVKSIWVELQPQD